MERRHSRGRTLRYAAKTAQLLLNRHPGVGANAKNVSYKNLVVLCAVNRQQRGACSGSPASTREDGMARMKWGGGGGMHSPNIPRGESSDAEIDSEYFLALLAARIRRDPKLREELLWGLTKLPPRDLGAETLHALLNCRPAQRFLLAQHRNGHLLLFDSDAQNPKPERFKFFHIADRCDAFFTLERVRCLMTISNDRSRRGWIKLVRIGESCW